MYNGFWAAARELGWSHDQVHDFANAELDRKKPIMSLKELGEQKLELLKKKSATEPAGRGERMQPRSNTRHPLASVGTFVGTGRPRRPSVAPSHDAHRNCILPCKIRTFVRLRATASYRVKTSKNRLISFNS